MIATLLIVLLAAEPSPPVATGGDATDGWRHAASFAWKSTELWSRADSRYGFGSLGVSYLVSTAASGAFLSLTVLFPVVASQDGASLSTGDWYSPSLELDLLLGWEWRWQLPHRFELEAGPGLHGSLIALTGKNNVRSFNAAPLGVGGQVTCRWRPGSGEGSGPSIGVVVAPTVDFWDPLHSSQLKVGLSLRAGLVAGWDVR